MAQFAQKVARVKHTDPGAPSVRWLTAREVPVEVYQRERERKPVDGTIVSGPGGQETFIGSIVGRSADVGERDSYQHSA